MNTIKSDFLKVEEKGWYELFIYKIDGSYWRLDNYDKYQQQYFTRLPSKKKWHEFDDLQLRLELLKRTKGITGKRCIWNNCENYTLNDLVFCEVHAYDMGIR